MEMPQITNSYSGNTANNNVCVSVNGVTVWFSYTTPIAFQVCGNPLVIRKNEWSNTTGKHLNAIDDDKSKRVDGETFRKLWNEQTEPYKLLADVM